MIAGVPDGPVAVPPAVADFACGRPVVAHWRNEAGGLTFSIGDPPNAYVKWNPVGTPVDLADEIDRLAWIGDRLPVPQVTDRGADDSGSWFASTAIDGTNAVDEHWRQRPVEAAHSIGAGLRQFHDALPVTDCPFRWDLDDRRDTARDVLTERRWDAPHYGSFRSLDPDEVAAALDDAPPIDRLVVAHGDACAPNTLIDAHGAVAGFVDLGSLGVADRWADLAVATWSTVWNHGPGVEDVVLDAYGIERDEQRLDYYRLLWAAT